VFPTVALGIGVVVAGLGIGALLSALQHRETTTRVSRAAPIVTPVARATRGPIAIATLVAHPTPTPTPTPGATATPTPTPRASVTPRATATAVASPAPAASARATATPASTPRATTPAPRASAAVRVAAVPEATPKPVPRPSLVPAVRVTPVVVTPAPRAEAVTPPSAAQSTVRRYLDALIAGNSRAAYAELGKPPGDPGASLSEEAILDRGSRITSLRTTSTDATGATVEVELATERGTYVATYHVTNGPGGPVIDQHDYIKI